jgi:hypothetical protein
MKYQEESRVLNVKANCNNYEGLSDIRIKTDIENLGIHPCFGISIYSWVYKNEDSTRYVGVMAQDLLTTKAYAHLVRIVSMGEFKGFYGVNYDELGIQMNTEAAWKASGLECLREPTIAVSD